ncbi:MAG: hypothetical protein HKN47_29230 [Pirellulaceae bacterium]|nr:hypothetical protein [Pirellulaceae bacterium]
MNDNTDRRKKSWRVFYIASCLFLLFPLLICGGVATWFLGRQSAASAKVDLRLADLDQRGQPVNEDSLRRSYEFNTSDQDSDAWIELGDRLESKAFVDAAAAMPFHDSSVVVPPPGTAWPDRKPIDNFLAAWQHDLSTLLKLALDQTAANRKPIRRPIDFDNALSTPLTDTNRLRGMVRLLQLQHAVAVHDGDRKLGFDCIQAGRGLERSTLNEPFMASQLIGRAIARNTNAMLMLSLQHDQLTDEQMTKIADAMVDFDELRETYLLALRGDRAMMLPVFTDAELANRVLDFDSPAVAKLLTRIRARDALYYLDQMQLYLDAAVSDPDRLDPDRLDPSAFRKRVSLAGDQLKSDIFASGTITNLDHMYSYLMIPNMQSFALVIVQQEENNRLAKLAMAVRKYQHDLDRWPTTLDQLSAIDIDLSMLQPVDEAKFGYRVDTNGDAILWGVPRSDLQVIGPDPLPVDDGEHAANRLWVWRLSP